MMTDTASKFLKRSGLKLPKGELYKLDGGVQYHWIKKGGHAGAKTIRDLIERAKSLGFETERDASDVSPGTGSFVAFVSKLSKDGVEIYCVMRYGITSRENVFEVSVNLSNKVLA